MRLQIPHLDNKRVRTVVLPTDEQLRHHDGMVGRTTQRPNPPLRRGQRRRMDRERLVILVPRGRGLQTTHIRPMTQLRLRIASDNLVFLRPLQEEFVLFGGSLFAKCNLSHRQIVSVIRHIRKSPTAKPNANSNSYQAGEGSPRTSKHAIHTASARPAAHSPHATPPWTSCSSRPAAAASSPCRATSGSARCGLASGSGTCRRQDRIGGASGGGLVCRGILSCVVVRPVGRRRRGTGRAPARGAASLGGRQASEPGPRRGVGKAFC